MDYKKQFDTAFYTVFKEQEKSGKEKLIQFHKEDRPFDFAHKQLSETYFRKLLNLEKKSKFQLGKYSSLFSQRRNLYSTNAGAKMLHNELFTTFSQEYGAEKYSSFIKDFASRFALKVAFLNNEQNKGLTAYLYHYNEITKFTLKKLKESIKTRNIFIEYENRSNFTVQGSYPLPVDDRIEPNLELRLKNELQKQIPEERGVPKNKSEGKIFPEFDEEEKLILSHFMFSKKATLSIVERTKLIFHVGGIEEGKTLLFEDPKFNKYYNIISKGPSYFGENTAVRILESIKLKIKLLDLPKLKAAINLSLINYKNSKLKKELEK